MSKEGEDVLLEKGFSKVSAVLSVDEFLDGPQQLRNEHHEKSDSDWIAHDLEKPLIVGNFTRVVLVVRFSDGVDEKFISERKIQKVQFVLVIHFVCQPEAIAYVQHRFQRFWDDPTWTQSLFLMKTCHR